MEKIKSFESFNEEKKEKWIQDAIKKPGSLRKSLGKKKGEKISKSEINSELSKLKGKDRDKSKPGLQLSKKDKTKQKRLTLARTLKSMHENFEEQLDVDPIKGKLKLEIVKKFSESIKDGDLISDKALIDYVFMEFEENLSDVLSNYNISEKEGDLGSFNP